MVLSPDATYPNMPMNAMPSNGNGTRMTYYNGLYRPQMAIPASGWADVQIANPLDPKMLVTYATLGSTLGTFVRSTNALQTAWSASPLAYTGNNTKVTSLDTTDAASTVDCNQWTFNHQMVNVAANIPPVLNNTIYLRRGAIYDNQVEIALGSATYNNAQFTFFQNLATSGQFLNGATGSIPVISFGNGFTGNQIMHLNLIKIGVYQMGLILQNSAGGAWSVFMMELVVLP